MIPKNELSGYLEDLAHSVQLPDSEAGAALWSLELLLEHVSFDPDIDVEEHLASFLKRVDNPSEKTLETALRIASLFGRQKGKLVRHKKR